MDRDRDRDRDRETVPLDGRPCQLAAQLRRVLGSPPVTTGVQAVTIYLHRLADQIEALEARNATLEAFVVALKVHLRATDVTRDALEAVEGRP